MGFVIWMIIFGLGIGIADGLSKLRNPWGGLAVLTFAILFMAFAAALIYWPGIHWS